MSNLIKYMMRVFFTPLLGAGFAFFNPNNHTDLLIVFSSSVFSQGEEGTSWYIILKGSVNVVIYGKVGI